MSVFARATLVALPTLVTSAGSMSRSVTTAQPPSAAPETNENELLMVDAWVKAMYHGSCAEPGGGAIDQSGMPLCNVGWRT